MKEFNVKPACGIWTIDFFNLPLRLRRNKSKRVMKIRVRTSHAMWFLVGYLIAQHRKYVLSAKFYCWISAVCAVIKFGMNLHVTEFGQVAHAPLPMLSLLCYIASGVRGRPGIYFRIVIVAISFRSFGCECHFEQATEPNYRRALTKDGVEKGSGTVCAVVCPDVCARYMDRGLLLNIMI